LKKGMDEMEEEKEGKKIVMELTSSCTVVVNITLFE